ncbi:MAG: hypothetical protein DBY45_00090 [Clostridiales bacterium]|nr:MAG: hypothetical protein DBY45_00090 [Clostridiales bacterium]
MKRGSLFPFQKGEIGFTEFLLLLYCTLIFGWKIIRYNKLVKRRKKKLKKPVKKTGSSPIQKG